MDNGAPRLYACLYRPPRAERLEGAPDEIVEIARDFSPRYEVRRQDLVVIDVSGLERLFGPAAAIGEALRRDATGRGIFAQIAVAGTQTAAMVLAQVQPGLTAVNGVHVVRAGAESEALAPVSLAILGKDDVFGLMSDVVLQACSRWGLRTLGDLAALPPADLVARLGREALTWQAIARGEDVRPLVPTLEEERFESTLELEWPIEGLEPLSFVLTRLLEPLSARLERRDRGAAVLHVLLRLVAPCAREVHARRLELPTPMRDVRSLRTLALLDLESHPPSAAIDRVTIVIDPTPGRVLQHRLFARAHPTPEQISTLLARLGALMGQDRIGTAATVDTYRPGVFAMQRFATEHMSPAPSTSEAQAAAGSSVVSALRRCRQPVPARVVVAGGNRVDRPVRVTTDRRGFAGGAVMQSAGPWRTSGDWWNTSSWNRDEWDVALSDGAVYRIFQDRETRAWFIDGIVD